MMSEVTWRWLGQAGFMLEFPNVRLLIDPYLSDSLAKKYNGKKFDHVRMMDSPLNPADLNQVNYVLCTHQHTDHMDPETLKPISDNNPGCMFVVPAAWAEKAAGFGIDQARLILVNAGQRVVLGNELLLDVIPSAHEKLVCDESGNHHYLGYVLKIKNGFVIYHSGDSVPYAGLEEKLSQWRINTAFLPVNGRDEHRIENGIPGNFFMSEAINLCNMVGIENLVCHHFGMFAFNSVEVSTLEQQIKQYRGKLKIVIPEPDKLYHVC